MPAATEEFRERWEAEKAAGLTTVSYADYLVRCRAGVNRAAADLALDTWRERGGE